MLNHHPTIGRNLILSIGDSDKRGKAAKIRWAKKNLLREKNNPGQKGKRKGGE